MKRKNPQQKRSTLVNKCDALFSQLVRLPGHCKQCGTTERLQCAHGFSRRYRAIRWDFRNAFCLCARCHMRYTHNPLLWEQWLRTEWGDDLYNELFVVALNGKSWTQAELEELRDSLSAQLKEVA